MNWDRIEGNWKQVTGKAKVQWGKLTDDDSWQARSRSATASPRMRPKSSSPPGRARPMNLGSRRTRTELIRV